MTSTPTTTSKPKRRTGRPKRGESPNVPWLTVEAELVFGVRHVDPKTGEERLKYPSLAELAKRYSVSPNLMWRFSHRHRCFERRKEVSAKAQARYEEKVIEKVANARALATADVVGVVDAYIAGFKQAMEDKKIRFDSAGDLEKMIRVRELLTGNADSRQELNGAVSLAAIQQRHRQVRDRVSGITPELSGTAPGDGDDDAAVHTDGEEGAHGPAR